MARQLGDDLENVVLALDENDERYRAGVVGANVRRRRKDLNLSQTELAKLISHTGWYVTPNIISALETNGHYGGKRNIHVTVTVDRVDVLARVLAVQASWLLDDRWQRSLRLRLRGRV